MSLPYPSLQGDCEFDTVPDAVRVLDDLVLRMKVQQSHLGQLADGLEQSHSRRSRRMARELKAELSQTQVLLAVHGFGKRRAT